MLDLDEVKSQFDQALAAKDPAWLASILRGLITETEELIFLLAEHDPEARQLLGNLAGWCP